MATRLIGTDSTDPWLPDIVKVHADQAQVDDLAGNFTASDVEGVLAELVDLVDDIVITGGSMPAASTAETIAGTSTTKAVTPAGYGEAQPFADVRRFGAVGDGATDDTAAIQAALTAAPAGSVIELAGRTYKVTALNVTTAVTVRNGALVGSNQIVLNVTAAGTVLQNLAITRDLTWNGVDAGSGVYVNADRVRVENCNFTNAYGSCLALADARNDFTVVGGTFTNASARQDASAIYIAAGATGHQRVHIDRVRVTSSACHGVAMYNCSDSSVSRSSVSSCRRLPTVTLTGWTLVSGNVYSTTDRTDGLTRMLSNNGAQLVESVTPTTPGSNQWGVSGGLVYVNLAGTNPNTRTMTSDIVSGYAIFYYDANGAGMYRNRIVDCNADDCDGFGIYVVGTGADMKISGCALRNVALAGSQHNSLAFAGMGLAGLNSVSVSNCSIDTAGSVGKTLSGVKTDAGTFKLTNVISRNCTNGGFNLWGDVTAVNCEAVSNTGSGFSVSPTATATVVRLIGCRSVSNTSHGIDVSPGAATVSFQMLGGYVANNTLRGVYIGTATYAVVNGVDVYNNAQQQILISATCPSAVVTNNRVGHTSTSAQGITVQVGAADTVLSGNLVHTMTTNAYTVSTPVKLSGSARTTSHWQGAGTPETFVTANVGSTYHRTDGGALTSFYVKETGTAATGWVAK